MDTGWTPRKRLKADESASSISPASSSSSSASVSPSASSPPGEEPEQPFAFLTQRRRCRLPCCIEPPPASGDVTLSRLSMAAPMQAMFFLPPPCEVAWFSGVCVEQRHGGGGSGGGGEDEDEDEEAAAGSATTGIRGQPSLLELDRRPLSLLAHESDIDDCLKCVQGGYLHFRVTLTDHARNTQGKVIVERAGGEMLRFEAADEDGAVAGPQLTFATKHSFAGSAAVTPLIERFFPSVLRRLSDAPDRQALLGDCVVCFGDLTLVDIPMHSIPDKKDGPSTLPAE